MFQKRDYFLLTGAAIAFVYSVVLWFGAFGAPNKEAGVFVGIWVPSILSLGCFAKLSARGNSDV
ncbi:MAG: hypothetical protein M3O50_06410 [Myxococcota bacterium]|nr:hypothetical protein [Myxococcota bacterium]